jgi:hypothetical protein
MMFIVNRMETLAVILCVALAVAYAVRRFRRAFAEENDPCAHCDGCALNDAKKRNSEAYGCERR